MTEYNYAFFLLLQLVSMEISVVESTDQPGDNSESNGKVDQKPSNSDKGSGVASCKNTSIQVEKANKMKDKAESGNSSLIKNAGSSKSTEVDPSSEPSQEFKLEINKQAKSTSNEELTKSDLNLVKVKTDVKKAKIKTDGNQAKGKVELFQVKGKGDQNPEKTITVPNKNKMKAETSQGTLQSVPSKVMAEDVQPKVKMSDPSPSKLKQDQNQMKTKIDVTKSTPKLASFSAKAVAYDAASKSKVATAPKPKKKFYFLFRVKEFNVMSNKKDDLKYKCHVCNGIYRQKFSLKRHFLRNHINHEYISFADISNCKINVPNEKIMQQVAEETKTPSGRKRFKTKDAIFLEGNKSRMMPGLYRCHECSEIKLDLESELKAHYVSHPNVQPDENFPCELCSAVFQKRAVLNKHMAAHHDKKTSNVCKKCKQEFPNDLDFQKHLSTQGNGGKCKYCEKEFCTTALRKKHEHLHEGMKGYSCKHCHEVFSKIDDVKKHVVKNHASLYLTCSYCPKQAFPHMFATKLLLAAHVREKHDVVSGKKPVIAVSTVYSNKNSNGKISTAAESVCNYCQKTFPGVRAMLRHKTIAHKRLLNKHKNAAQKKNALAKKQNTMAAKQKAYNKKIANEKKIQQQKKANQHKVLHKERTTYERKAKQAVQDKSVIERFSTRRMRFESSRIAMNRFYANLAQNIAENLLEHVDGRAHQLSIKNYNFSDNNEFYEDGSHHDHDKIPWSSYNFPTDFDVQHALDKKGQEIKPKVPEEEQCLYATGLGKVSSNSDEDTDTSTSSSVCKDVTESKDKTYDAATLRTLSLEEKKKLLQYEPVIVFICCICKQKYSSFQEMDDHIHNNHPNVEPSWIEVEGTKDTPPLVPLDLCREPYANPDGVLFSCVVPPLMPEICTLKCTKCYHIFQKSSELHQHLLECGGNESFRPRYRKKLNLQKRIKHTMKHRMDLSVKQVASKKESPSKDFRNGRIEKTKIKYGKDYFSTKTGKNVRAQSPLAFQQKNITCFFCKEKFDSKLLLTEHYSVCSKFNRKRKRKTASPTTKKNLPNPNQTSGVNNQAVEAKAEAVNNIPKPNLQTSSENGLDLTMVTATKAPAENSTSDSGVSKSSSTLPDIILSSNKTGKLSKPAIKESSAMDLSIKPVKQIVVTKLTVPSNLVKSKVISNANARKTPIEALHETVQRIEANGTRKDNSNLNICKSPLQRSKKTEVVVNRSFVQPKLIAPKPTVPNIQQNLPKIKEVINEIKLAASNSPNLKKTATPLMFIVSSSDVNNGAVRNINSAISAIKTNLNDQTSSEASNKLKEQPFVARRKRKKEQPTKVVQKTADIAIETSKLDSPKAILLVSQNKDENQKAIVPSTNATTNASINCTKSEDLSESDKHVKNLSSETELPINTTEKSTVVTTESPANSTLIQTSAIPIVVPSSAVTADPSIVSTNINQDKVADLFISNEKSDAKCNQSEDRDSPTLELLVSSVTQNIENFDKPSFLDDEKFSLPSLNISSNVPRSNDKVIESARNSLNFRIIIPDVESQTGSLLKSGGQQASEINSELRNSLPTINAPIPVSECQNKSDERTSVLPSVGLSEKTKDSEKASPFKDKQNDSPVTDSIENESNVSSTENLSTPHFLSPKLQGTDKDLSSKSDVVNNQLGDNATCEIENRNSATPSEIKSTSDSVSVPNSSENNQLSTTTDKQATKQQSTLNTEQVNVTNSETSPNASLDVASKQAVPDLGPFDSIDEAIAAVLKGGSWRRGRRPSKRPPGRPRGARRNKYSKPLNDFEELNLPANPMSSPTKPTKSKNTKVKPSSTNANTSSQLRAFRIENSDLPTKTLSEASSGKSDHSNSSEVASDFGKDLASRMKARMRLSIGTPSESGNDSRLESSKKSVDDSQRDSSTPSLPEISDANEGHDAVASIKKEFKETENSKKHICPFCILEFAYLTNFRRHLKICKSKYDNLTVETPASTSSTSQIQHLPKKDEVEESMLNLLRHQSRQNQMIKETQPVKACDQEKNFQKFSCESCHKIYFSLFKLMQHRMKEHLMPSSESKTLTLEDQSAPEFDEESQCSADSSFKDDAEPENMSNHPVEGVFNDPLSADSNQEPSSVIASEDKTEEDQINCAEKEDNLAEESQINLSSEDIRGSSPTTDILSDATLDEFTAEAKEKESKPLTDSEDSQATTVGESSSNTKHSIDSTKKSGKGKSSYLQKKYKELIDPNYFAIPYGKGRGRKKKSLVKTVEGNVIEETDKIEVEVSDNEKSKNTPQKIEEKGKEKIPVDSSPKESTSNENRRDIYLQILENCSKLSIVKNVTPKDNTKLKVSSQNEKLKNNKLESAGGIQSNMPNTSSPVKKRGRPRFSSIAEKKEMSKVTLLDMNDNIDVYTVSSEKNSKEITVVKETNTHGPSFLAVSSPKKPGRKRAAESSPINAPKLQRGKYIRVKKVIPTYSPDTSEIETDDSASFIVSGNDVIPSPTQITKFHSSKSRFLAKSSDIPRKQGKQSAIHKFLPASSMIKVTKASKSLKTVSLSVAGHAVESSPISNSAHSKSKAVKRIVKTSCDNKPGSSIIVTKGMPKNSKALKTHSVSSPDDPSDFQEISFRKRVRDAICPICKKRFSAPLIRNRHVQLAHGRKNTRVDDAEILSDMPEDGQQLNKQFSDTEVRPKFQRHCIKPLPPMKRKYQKTMSSIARFKKQKKVNA